MIDQKCKYRGIIRNKMTDLNHLKGRKKMPIKRFSKTALRKAIDDEEIIKSGLLSDETKPSEMEMSYFENPSWIVPYIQCCGLLKEVQILQNEIGKEQIKKMSSVCQKKHDKVIQQFVEEATIKLNKCQRKLKQMERDAAFSSETTPAQKKNFTSMLISMANNVRQQTRKLRGQQQSQLHREHQLNKSTNKALQSIKTDASETQSWLSQQDFQVLEKNMAKQRNEQVNKIIQSIYSLNSIYKELQGLVIEQGSLLDRIDQNIQNTVDSVTKAKKHLQEATQKQNSNCIRKLRRILVSLILLLLFIFIIKHT